MKTVIALLAVLAVAAVSVFVRGKEGDDSTWVSNQSSKFIRASTEYDFQGHSDFQNRLIAPGTAQMDVYTKEYCQGTGEDNPVGVTLWIDGSSSQHKIKISCDQSIVGEDNSDKSGVIIYASIYDHINEPTGGVLVTLYP